ncbi:hypothetical protein GCM10020219_002590 [Nonomuraea dietziae]
MDVNEVLLPGVGLRYEFTNQDGDRIGVVARRTGEFELVVYGSEDPDQGRSMLRLNREEADTLAEILGAPRIAERFADLTKEVPGTERGADGGAGRLSVRGSPAGAHQGAKPYGSIHRGDRPRGRCDRVPHA